MSYICVSELSHHCFRYWRLFGAKPLSKTNDNVTSIAPKKHTFMKTSSKLNYMHPWKCISMLLSVIWPPFHPVNRCRHLEWDIFKCRCCWYVKNMHNFIPMVKSKSYMRNIILILFYILATYILSVIIDNAVCCCRYDMLHYHQSNCLYHGL